MCRVLGHIQWENHGWSFGLICFSGNIISVLYMLSPVWVVILVYVSSRVLKYLVSKIAYNWRKTWNAICRPTFSRIVKHRSTEEFESLPYVSSLATSSLWVFYGLMKSGGLLIATVNGFGIIIELVYVILFLIFAPTRMRVKLYTVILQLYIPIYDYDHMCICIFFIHIHDLCHILYLFQAKTAILVVTLNVGFPAGVVLITLIVMDGDLRLDVLGIVCAVLNILMYGSPFTAMVRI